MRDVDFLNIQLLDLEIFLRVAEYESFTKAAERMFLTQSGVSKRINMLEAELGLQLFYRNKRTVTLTPAGKLLSARLVNVNTDIMNAVEDAHNIQSGMSGHLHFGFLEWGNSCYMEILEKFVLENPQISIDISRNHFYELRNSLFSEQTDIILTTSYDIDVFSEGKYNFKNLEEMPLYAYLSPKHHLADRTSLRITDLKSEALLMLDYKFAPGYHSYIHNLFLAENIKPLVSLYARNGGEHLGNVLLNKGILLASKAFLENTWKEQIYRIPIENTKLYITAVWKKTNKNPALEKFLKMI